MKTKVLQSMYMIFDCLGNPVVNSLRYHRKNSIGSMEAREWEKLSSQGWKCEKVTITIEKEEK